MKLTIILLSVMKSQIEPDLQNAITDIACELYLKRFGDSHVSVVLRDGKGGVDDFIVAYDEFLPVPNASQKLQEYTNALGQEMKRILPQSLCFGGRGSIMAMSAVKNAPPAPKTETEPEKKSGENAFVELAKQYSAERPRFTFDQVVLASDVRSAIDDAVTVLQHRELLFDTWGLKSIMSPSVLLNLYGASGTGKTMVAEAIASRIEKPIIRATYADIESKYHGEGPQKLKAIFLAAAMQDAVLFIDEADSMLSSRLSGVSNGSEQAINSMRSQLLICLENFDGVVIFATNLIENYDPAFLTRLICIEMKRPDVNSREQIWHNHLYSVAGTEAQLRIPSGGDWNLKELAEKYEFCGRDIRNAVKQACISAVRRGLEKGVPKDQIRVYQKDLVYAADETLRRAQELESARKQTVGFREPQISEERNKQIARQVTQAVIKKAESKSSET